MSPDVGHDEQGRTWYKGFKSLTINNYGNHGLQHQRKAHKLEKEVHQERAHERVHHSFPLQTVSMP